MDRHRHIEPAYYLGADLLTLFVAFFLSVYFFNDGNLGRVDWDVFFVVILLWFLIGYWRKLYYLHVHSLGSRVLNFAKAYLTLLSIVALLYYMSPLAFSSTRSLTAFLIAFPLLGVMLNTLVINYLNYFEPHKKSKRYTLVAGIGRMAENVGKHLGKSSSENRIIKGYISCKKKEKCMVSHDKVVSDLDHINDYLKTNPVDEIVIALPIKAAKKIKNIIAAADHYGVRVKYIPDYKDIFGENYKVTRYGQLDAINIRQMPLDDQKYYFIKNAFDKIFASIALAFLSPLLVLIALLIKLDSPGPIFYCPKRIGRGGKPFKVLKFRSMKENDSADGGMLSTQKNDARITKVGKFIRKYSLDELPQFINVLTGEMSVVGPRPHRSFLSQQFQESEEKYMIRHYFKPGITGWAQVNGWRGPTETSEQKRQRTLHDLWYMENWTLWLDIKIIYMTVFGNKTHLSAF